MTSKILVHGSPNGVAALRRKILLAAYPGIIMIITGDSDTNAIIAILAEYVGGKANYNSIVGRCANRIPDGARIPRDVFTCCGIRHPLEAVGAQWCLLAYYNPCRAIAMAKMTQDASKSMAVVL